MLDTEIKSKIDFGDPRTSRKAVLIFRTAVRACFGDAQLGVPSWAHAQPCV